MPHDEGIIVPDTRTHIREGEGAEEYLETLRRRYGQDLSDAELYRRARDEVAAQQEAEEGELTTETLEPIVESAVEDAIEDTLLDSAGAVDVDLDNPEALVDELATELSRRLMDEQGRIQAAAQILVTDELVHGFERGVRDALGDFTDESGRLRVAVEERPADAESDH